MYHRLLLSSPASLDAVKQPPLWNSCPRLSVRKWRPAGLWGFTDSIGSVLLNLHWRHWCFCWAIIRNVRASFKVSSPTAAESEPWRPYLGSQQQHQCDWFMTWHRRREEKEAEEVWHVSSEVWAWHQSCCTCVLPVMCDKALKLCQPDCKCIPTPFWEPLQRTGRTSKAASAEWLLQPDHCWKKQI